MPSKTQREGYLQIDHRNSPGLSEADVRESDGRAVAVRSGQNFESATLTCGHCQNQIIRNPGRLRDRAYCRSCDHYICDTCEGVRVRAGGRCDSFAKLLDQVYGATNKAQSAIETIRKLRASILR